jgi:type II secretory pathway component PulF
MHNTIPTLIVCLQIGGGLIVLGLMLLLPMAGGAIGLGGLVFLLLVNGWAVYAFLSSRQGQQDELAQVLTAAVEGGVPLAPAVRSYLQDRPTSQERVGPTPFTSRIPLLDAYLRLIRVGVSAGSRTLLIFGYMLLPLYTYIRLWIGWWSFDRLVTALADRLESGESLSGALQALPQVACREVRLAVSLGEATGALGPCLKGAERERWSAAWFEVAPRLLYPLLVLVFVLCIASYLMIKIVPKFRKIFQEFGEPLPQLTRTLIDCWVAFEVFIPVVLLMMFLAFVAIATVIANPTVRWYTPIVGRLYRWGMQAEILRALGRLLAVGQTVPQALGFLTDAAVLPLVVRRRLDVATAIVERGEPLADALGGAGLLPTSMAPLVRSAEKVRTLPWALGELGGHLADRAFRLVRWVSVVVAPLMVVAIGAVVGFVDIAMFLPLIQLLTRLST